MVIPLDWGLKDRKENLDPQCTLKDPLDQLVKLVLMDFADTTVHPETLVSQVTPVLQDVMVSRVRRVLLDHLEDTL